VSVPVDAQTVALPGDSPGIAVVVAPDGTRTRVAGDYREVHLQIQAAAARGHESGTIEDQNTPVS
jgi:hypothetical protein